jgi:hypothetical protein
MKKLTLVAACAVTALGLAAAGQGAQTRQQFSVIATSYTSKKTGDTETFKEHLTVGGKRVGHDVITCVPHGARMLCHGIISLRNGQIRVRVIAGGGPDTTGTITGGTGGYSHAHGTVRLHGLPHGRDRITFRIT